MIKVIRELIAKFAMKKGIVQPFLLFLASVAFIISVLVILDDQSKAKTQNPTQSASRSPLNETASTDEGSVYIDKGTANWKTYTNSKYKYSLSYPNNWYVIEPGKDGTKSINIQNYSGSVLTEDEKKNVSAGPNKISITIGLYDEKIENNQSLTDFLKATDQWDSAMVGEPTSVEDIKIADKPALKLNYAGTFYVFSDGENVFYSYFDPKDSHLSSTFDQILSTFRFVE